MFEHHNEKLVPLSRFLQRMFLFLVLAFAALCVALALGVAGYHWVAGLSWIDALLNASMILTGMGPVDPMTTTASKLFASGYALFSGVVFLSSIGFVFTPVLHRVLHRFHLDEPAQPKGPESESA